MRAILLCALGLAASACGSDIGNPCSLDDPCGDGVCNLSGPGDPVCVEEDGDLDGDGLPNKSDFCNQQAGGQFDEEGDGIGDDCDPCPIARPSGRDTDTDGVDYPCDPDPAINGNMMSFEGFNGTLPATWRKEGTGGTWDVRGGAALFTATDPGQIATLTVPLPISSNHIAVHAAYRVDRLDTTALQNLAGTISISRLPLGTTSVTCSGSRVSGMDSLVVNSSLDNVAMGLPNLFDSAGLYRITELINGAMGACAIEAATQEGAVTAQISNEAPTEAGLSARAIDAKFTYLVIVQRRN